MPLIRARGITLLELAIGLSLFGVIGTLLVRTSLQLSRGVAQLQQRGSAQAALEQGGAWLVSEVADLAPGDLRAMASDAFRYRGLRVAGLACAVTEFEVRLIAQTQPGGRGPQPGRDSLLLYTGASRDSGWTAFPILAVGATTCGGATAIRLDTAIDSLTLRRAAGMTLVPARVFESMQARFYTSAGNWWLGARSESANEGLQPLAGPYAAAGVQLQYRDSLGRPASDPAAVRQYLVRLETGDPVPDSALFHLTPANLRP